MHVCCGAGWGGTRCQVFIWRRAGTARCPGRNPLMCARRSPPWPTQSFATRWTAATGGASRRLASPSPSVSGHAGGHATDERAIPPRSRAQAGPMPASFRLRSCLLSTVSTPWPALHRRAALRVLLRRRPRVCHAHGPAARRRFCAPHRRARHQLPAAAAGAWAALVHCLSRPACAAGAARGWLPS